MKPALDLDHLFPELALISDATLRTSVEAVWQELWQASPFDRIDDLPSSTEIPYPHIPHNRAVIALALAAADVFERFHDVFVDRDVLIAAALLQDVSKLVEYQPGPEGASLSTLGKGYPHAFWAAHVALAHGVPDAVCQVVLSHTPNSPKFPDSIEGKILYYVDQMDVIAIYGDRWRKELFITK